MARALHSIGDVINKMSGSICTWDGRPYQVFVDEMEVQTANKVRLTDMESGNYFMSVDYTDDKFDYSSLPVGYMQVDNKAHFVYKNPARLNGVGLQSRSLFCDTLHYVRDFFGSRELYNCIVGRHFTYLEAVAKAKGSSAGSTYAFHREGAVYHVGNASLMLMFRGRMIATIDPSTSKISLLRSNNDKVAKKKLMHLGVAEYAID